MNDLKHSNYQRRSQEEWEVIFQNYGMTDEQIQYVINMIDEFK